MDNLREPLSFSGFDADEAAQFLDAYEPSEQAGIRSALEFAERHPDHDFAGLVPGIPYSNAQIHAFLCRLRRSLFSTGEAS
ncbi:hypothetical protein [Burkholderia alba]|uniref:hypothetical protein n=1 Tax=Burkholderia alba TaxID=2683677 RepID=UPI002B056223|nr:hypothetical protein [Burkholderia alba]